MMLHDKKKIKHPWAMVKNKFVIYFYFLFYPESVCPSTAAEYLLDFPAFIVLYVHVQLLFACA